VVTTTSSVGPIPIGERCVVGGTLHGVQDRGPDLDIAVVADLDFDLDLAESGIGRLSFF
jgi:hypothetical protein